MRFPLSTSKSILHQSLPSIQTLFTPSPKDGNIVRSPLLGSPEQVLDGIEVVPLERQNSSTTKICTPGTEEKEVVAGWKENLDLELASKPLPSLPGSRWTRMSTKHRVIALLCLQSVMLLTIGLGFMVVRGKKLARHDSSFVQFADPGVPSAFLPMQRGTFVLSIGTPEQKNAACLALKKEAAAWTCSAHKPVLLTFHLSAVDQKNVTFMSIKSTSRANSSTYGIQDAEIDPLALTPMVDPERVNSGAAYYFRTKYSRTVLLKEEQLFNEGRNDLDLPDAKIPIIQSGDRPWLCVFNETLLEGYIYVSENSTCTNGATNPGVGNSTVANNIPCMPYMMKLMEQRVPNSTQPYCSRMLMDQDGNLVNDGTSQMLKLSESDRVPQKVANGTDTSTEKRRRQKAPSPNSCRCQWMVQ